MKKQAIRVLKDLEERYRNTIRSKYSEHDTITKFIMPLLKALGWNIYDIDEVKQEVKVGEKMLDCALYLNRRIYVAIEVKPLTYGKNLEEDNQEITKLLREAKTLRSKYAMLTQFGKTVIYDPRSEQKIAYFEIHGKNGYIDDFEKLWNLLSKESALSSSNFLNETNQRD